MRFIKEKAKLLIPNNVWSYLVFFRNTPKMFKRLTYRVVLYLCGNRFFLAGFNAIFKPLNLEIRNFTTLLDSCTSKHNSFEILNKRDIQYSYAAPTFWPDSTRNEIKSLQVKDCCDVIIRNAQIIGNSNLLLFGNISASYELKDYDNEVKFKYTDGGIEAYNLKVVLVKYSKKSRNIDQGIKLTANYSWNYYHLIYEVLSKFFYIQISAIPQNIPLLVDKVIMDVPQYKELLDVFNTTNRAIITIEKGERCFVKELYCVPDGQIGPPNYLKIGNVLPEDNKIDLNSLFFLRETLIKHRAERNFPKRIFLSRKNASKRRKYNEDEVYIAIEKYGFEKVLPENYSISEQIALFNGADFIIGTTGAAFSNTLFCNPRCKILCFTNYNIAFSVFSTINCFVKTELIYIYDKTLKYNNKSLLHDDFNVDINELEYFIKTQWML